jgi:hypothetical protein
MKKLLIGFVAAMCCFAMAAPAVAQVKLSGMITLDALVYDQDKERAVAAGVPVATPTTREDRTRTGIDLPQALNRFDAQWTSEDKKVHGRLQFRGGTGTAGGFGRVDTFAIEYAYIDYHWTPNWYSRFGRSEQTFSIMAPSQTLGQAQAHIVGAGWGNVHGGTARDSIKNYFKFTDMVRLEIALIDPDNDDAAAEAIPGGTARAGAAIEENSVIPRIDAALNIKIANFVIEPSVTWLTQEYEGLAAGEEDTLDIWGAAVGISAGFGPFKMAGEVTYGENLGVGNYVGANGAPFGFANAAGNRQVEDTEEIAAWIDLGFNFGPAEIHGIIGYQQWENDGSPLLANDSNDRERWMYGVNLPIKMTKNFTIKPEIFFYDDDDGATVAGVATDFGSEWIAGLQFQLVF